MMTAPAAHYKPIGAYGVIGNCRSAALVGVDGSIDWCCFPRFDSSSLFAAILDDARGGRFRLRPLGEYRSEQAYVPDTNILRTTFHTGQGVGSVTDFMPCYEDKGSRHQAFPEIHRTVRCEEGELDVEVLFDPRFDYARAATTWETGRWGVVTRGDTYCVSLATPVPLEVSPAGASARLHLRRGEEVTFVIRYGQAHPRPLASYHTPQKLASTAEYWERKASGCRCAGPWRDSIVRSFLALHLLVHSPTGAIVVAPTTSSTPSSCAGWL